MENAKLIIQKLKDNGFQAYIAGGAVRDMLLGLEPHDYDIVTSAMPEQVEELFERTLPIGKSFGVIQVMVNMEVYEVATFRKDSKDGDGRRPSSVELLCSAEDDMYRRDFTINGLLYDPLNGKVSDFVGGQADLKKGLVRFIGDPDARIAEDKLRMLRGVRFGARFGTLEQASLEAIKRHAHEIHNVSFERIQQEIIKMLEVGKPRKVIDLLFETGLMHEILPEFELLKGTPQDPYWHPEGDVKNHTVLVMEHLVGEPIVLQLAGMFHDIGKPQTTIFEGERVRTPEHAKVGAKITRDVLKRLKFSNEMIEGVGEMVYEHMKMISVPDMRKASQKKFFAQDNFPMLFKLHEADRQAGANRTETLEAVQALLDKYASEPVKPKPFVDGRDLIDMGMKPGKEIGKVKNVLYDRQLESEFESREQALDMARKLVEELS